MLRRRRTRRRSRQTFVNKDAAATLKLGQARGIAMLVPALAGLAVAEYAPNAVKKAVIGVGHGDKRQIHMMVRVLMPKAIFDSEMRPTRWRSPSATRITGRASTYRLAAGGVAHVLDLFRLYALSNTLEVLPCA